ncbi:MAG: Collagen-like protein [Euryarchaeota archaeon]|nr:Collagen-like protein [Euryarchaeota archaeon]
MVVSTFSFAPGWDLSGRLINDPKGYSPLVESGSTLYLDSDLGWYDSSNPIMSGVSSLHTFFRDDTTLASGAELVASWADGKPLMATKGNVVAITLWPGSSGRTGTYFDDWTGDVPQLYHNALIYRGTPTANVPEFPSVALPVASILALVVIFGRKKNMIK